jgi:predicted NBD/HSP70 family sugar kinase
MQRRMNIPKEKMIGIGVSAPGPLDGENGRILNPPRFDLWHYTELGSILQQRLGLPVYLENNASCLARYNQGKEEAQGSENFLLLLVDSGVGSGVVSHGKIFKGAGYFTSELGHTSIDYRGRSCTCGNVGCLEAYAAIPNLLRDTPFSNWQEVMEFFGKDPKAAELVELETDYLAAGVANMTNLVSVDTVLLAGDLLCGVETVAPILERKINSRTMRRSILPVRVLPSCSGPDSRVQAAADVAFGRFLMV